MTRRKIKLKKVLRARSRLLVMVASLMLLSRKGLKSQQLEDLGSKHGGKKIEVLSCDVGNVELSPLRRSSASDPAVFHLAGLVLDSLIPSQSSSALSAVFLPKCSGLLRLRRTARAALTVVFTSVSGALGNGGQSNYAAANSLLDFAVTQYDTRGDRAASIEFRPSQYFKVLFQLVCAHENRQT